MSHFATVRDAIRQEIKRINSEIARLRALEAQLDGPAGGLPVTRTAKRATRRLRLKPDVAADISTKIVKAVRAHRDGASRANIVQYLDRCGWQLGHHFNKPHLDKLVNTLVEGESPEIRREGERANSRYFVVG